MITIMSEKLTSFLCRKKIIPEDRKEIYQYGYEVLISGLLGFFIAGIIGFLMGRFFDAVIFLCLFVPVRRFCGGYHANTYLKCNIVFTFVFVLVMVVSGLMQREISFVYLVMLLLIYLWVIYKFSPMENSGKPLDEEQKIKNRKISLIMSLICCVASAVVYFTSQRVAILIAMTLFAIACLLIAEKYRMLQKNKNSRI